VAGQPELKRGIATTCSMTESRKNEPEV